MPRILIEWGDGDRRWRAPKVSRSEQPVIVHGSPADAGAVRSVEAQPQPEVEGSPIGDPLTDESREAAWQNIDETYERYVAGMKAGDDGPVSEGRRYYVGGAIATFALLTGQDGDTLNRQLSEKYPLPTYQGMRVKDPHQTTRPDRHPGSQRPVDPNEDEAEAFGVEVEDEESEAAE